MTMATLKEREAEIIEAFEWVEDEIDRYELIIEMGKSLPILPEEYKIPAFEIKGCQSKVWLVTKEHNQRIFFEADSNTMITKGIIALLLRVVNDSSKEELKNYQFDFIDAIQLRSHLTSQRSNGLSSMIQKIKSAV